MSSSAQLEDLLDQALRMSTFIIVQGDLTVCECRPNRTCLIDRRNKERKVFGVEEVPLNLLRCKQFEGTISEAARCCSATSVAKLLERAHKSATARGYLAASSSESVRAARLVGFRAIRPRDRTRHKHTHTFLVLVPVRLGRRRRRPLALQRQLFDGPCQA